MLDACGRNIEYLRISITDRCNLRCIYCMPEGGVSAMRHEDMLTYEEIERIVRLMARLGVRHLRVTGGEPMARKGCLKLVEKLHAIDGIEDVAMTTNALLLDGRIAEAKAAGLSSLNISLDTLDAQTFKMLTRGGDVSRVRTTIDEALANGLRVKINAVPIDGINDGQLVDVAKLAKDRPICVRFIELMPVGCGRNLKPIPSDRVLGLMRDAFGTLEEDEVQHGYGPARYLKPAGFVGSIGVISAMSHEFCDQCNRVRLTAEGYLKLCLNHTAGLDLRALLRGGADDEKIAEELKKAIANKPRRHGFLDEIGDRESRRMNEIGG